MTKMFSQRFVANAALFFLAFMPHAIAQSGPDVKPGDIPQRNNDVELEHAKEAYVKRVAEVEESMTRMIEEALQKARRRARNIKEEELRAARAAFLAAFDSAIQRATQTGDLEQASRLTAEKQSVEGHGIAVPDVDPDQFRDRAIYKCVLGTYGRYAHEVSYPIVNLSVPNRDLWSEAIQLKLRGRIDFHEINYRGNAKLIVPEDGVYTLEIPSRGTGFELNRRTLNGGDVELRKGVYNVRITTGTHGQPYLPDSYVRILHKGTNRELPFVNTGSDIKTFLSHTIDRQTVVEVSGYCPEELDPDLQSLSSAEQ